MVFHKLSCVGHIIKYCSTASIKVSHLEKIRDTVDTDMPNLYAKSL